MNADYRTLITDVNRGKTSPRFLLFVFFAIFCATFPARLFAACDPVGWWKLNETNGTTAADSSTNANNGSLLDSPTWTNGVQGSSLRFTNTGQRVNISHQSYYNLTNSITLSAWIRPDSIPGSNARFFTKGVAYDDGWGLMMDPSGYIVFQMTGVNGNSLSGISKPPTTRWTHVAATFDRSNGKIAKLYVNGILEQTTTFSGNMSNSTSNVRLGGHTAVLP